MTFGKKKEVVSPVERSMRRLIETLTIPRRWMLMIRVFCSLTAGLAVEMTIEEHAIIESRETVVVNFIVGL